MNEQTHGCEVCTSTVYSYMDQGLIKGVSNESLLEKPARRKRRNNLITRKPKKQRPRIFYAHAHASRERGSNDNGNRMIRRLIKKGRDIASFGRERVRQIEEWINRHPRKILDFQTAEERYVLELATGVIFSHPECGI